MSVKVLITDPVDKTLIEKLSQYNVQIDYKPEIEREELLKIIGNYDVLVVRSRTKVDKEVIEKGTNLKVVARAGIGLDNIDTDEAEKRKIKVVYAPGASTDSAAELTIGLLLVAARNLYESIGLAKNGVFKKTQGIELAGKTIGIIGFGRIGSKVGQVAKALGMHVLAYDVMDVRERAKQIGAEVVDLQEVIVTPHIGAQTKEAQLRVAQMTADNLITALKELGLI